MSGPHWNALMNMPNPGQAFMDSYNRAREQKRQEAVQAEDRAWQREQRGRQRGEWQREDETRSAKSGILMGGFNALMPAGTGSAAEPTDTTPPNQSGGSPAPEQPGYSPDAQRLIQADPDAFLTFQGNRLDVTGKQLKAARDLNDMAMQLLGGVHDQASYDAAKQRALQLYTAHGHDAREFIGGLPPQFSPEVVEGLRLQGMDSSQQMQAIARENRLEWDMEDDRLDNERADETAASQSTYRERRLGQFEDANRNRPAARTGSDRPKSEGAIYADIMDRWRKGGEPNAREREFVRAFEARRSGKGKGGGKRSGGGASGRSAVIVNPKTGERMKLEGGKWVPVK